MSDPAKPELGVVVIGRNEGPRLRDCLTAALKQTSRVVYVDSGSTDGSVELARSMNVDALPLDRSAPFSAARGRNEGFARLTAAHPMLDFVQFVDGDAVMFDSWMPTAAKALLADERVAVVCGLRRERRPDASIYNRMCDVEWNKPLGKSQACEGDAMVRPSAFKQVGGFDASLIAGEEPEFCLRLRRAGWDILRIGNDMTLHDAGMLHFRQWWKREARAGHAYAEGAAMYGAAHGLKRAAGIFFWGGFLPVLALVFLIKTRGISFLVALLLYLVLGFRSWRGTWRRANAFEDAIAYAFFCVLGKFPMCVGLMQFWIHRVAGRRGKIIEYKRPGGTSVSASVLTAEPQQ